jgi:hypothetical protein
LKEEKTEMKTCEFCGKKIGFLVLRYTWIDKKNNIAVHNICYEKYMDESPDKRKQKHKTKKEK